MSAGRLELVVGPMFSGKTAALIIRTEQMENLRNWKVAVFKPVTDTRHDEPAVISHNGLSIPAKWLERDARDLPRDVDLIAIDEIQFFSLDAIPNIMDAVLAGVHVIAAGLDLTYRAEPFGPVPALLCLADDVTKLTSRCSKCFRPATRSQRRVGVPDTVLVGGAESYEPRCLACFTPNGGGA
jgi:thymidine kinase